MSDLIARLRAWSKPITIPPGGLTMRIPVSSGLAEEAADRIESLERELAELRAQQPKAE